MEGVKDGVIPVAGFIPVSLCDYPGRVASVVFIQGCNFRCPWCHNPHLIPMADGDFPVSTSHEKWIDAADGIEPPDRAPVFTSHEKWIDEERVLAALAERRGRVEGAVVTGGEPTLQPALPRFLRRLKALGLRVKLDTNGSRPGVLRGLLAEGTLDFVAMDVKAPWARYAELTGLDACDTDAVRESLALVAASGVAHHFRTTRVDPLLSERDYEAIRRQIPAGSPHVWQTFRPVKEEIAS